jgi:hypothetical protein
MNNSHLRAVRQCLGVMKRTTSAVSAVFEQMVIARILQMGDGGMR